MFYSAWLKDHRVFSTFCLVSPFLIICLLFFLFLLGQGKQLIFVYYLYLCSGVAICSGRWWVSRRRLFARDKRIGHVDGHLPVRSVVQRSHHDHRVQRFACHVVDGSLFFQRTDFATHANQSAATSATRPAEKKQKTDNNIIT